MFSFSRFAAVFALVGLAGASGQDVPTLSTPIPSQQITVGGASFAINLRNHFSLPSIADNVVQFDTVLGRFNVELKKEKTPLHTANFLAYLRAGAYTNTFFHRTAYFSTSTQPAITQAGGFKLPYSSLVDKYSSLALEGDLPNKRGTMAAARLGSPTASATNQFYFNTKDNSVDLPAADREGYTVFGQVLGKGMSVVDAIAAVPVYDARDGSANTSAFDTLPLRNKVGNVLTEQNLVIIRSVIELPIYPTGTGISVLSFTAQSSNPAVAQVSLSGSALLITPGSVIGSATVTVEAKDTNGSVASAAFPVTSEIAILKSPQTQTVLIGDSVAFRVVAAGTGLTYQWKRDGLDVTGGTDSMLLLTGVIPGSAGSYSVEVSNGNVSLTSFAATLFVSDGVPKGRLSNLSVRSIAGLGSQTLIAGFSLAGTGEAGLVIRGIGPTLANYGVSGFLEDPRLELYSISGSLLSSNDNWASEDGHLVGGFSLPVGSKDSVLSMQLPVALYTAQVKGAGTSTGDALLELYEVPPATTANELINLSARTQLVASQTLIAGFNIAPGTNRTVLIRAIGPGLSRFDVGDPLQDPHLILYNSGGVSIDDNDNWGGTPTLVQTMLRAGAFVPALESKDSALLVTLPAGRYSAHVSGPPGASGVVLLEVYLVR